MADGVIRIMRSGESIGDLRSVLTAHRIAHLFLAEWPELAPLTVVDSAHRESWAVRLGDCSPLYCDIALGYAPYREWVSYRETVELMNDPDALPPVSYSTTNSGLPVRVPAALPVRAVDTVVDPALLRRVVERLRRL